MTALETIRQPEQQKRGGEHLARWCRSLIVTRGPNLERLYKAQATDADIVLYDLEDGVSSTHKAEARLTFQTVCGADLRHPLGMRINCPRTEAGLCDLEMLRSAAAQPLVIVLPKVESARDVQVVDEILTHAGSEAWLWAILESGAGIIEANEIAQASERLAALSFGSADFCAETGIAMKWEALTYARSQVVLAARTAGLGVLDAPTFALDDPDLLAFEAAAAADLGFTGKIAIHPKQLPVINGAFMPSPEQVDWARSVVEALENRPASIATVRGRMVGPPFLRAAQRILTQAKQRAS